MDTPIEGLWTPPQRLSCALPLCQVQSSEFVEVTLAHEGRQHFHPPCWERKEAELRAAWVTRWPGSARVVPVTLRPLRELLIHWWHQPHLRAEVVANEAQNVAFSVTFQPRENELQQLTVTPWLAAEVGQWQYVVTGQSVRLEPQPQAPARARVAEWSGETPHTVTQAAGRRRFEEGSFVVERTGRSQCRLNWRCCYLPQGQVAHALFCNTEETPTVANWGLVESTRSLLVPLSLSDQWLRRHQASLIVRRRSS